MRLNILFGIGLLCFSLSQTTWAETTSPSPTMPGISDPIDKTPPVKTCSFYCPRELSAKWKTSGCALPLKCKLVEDSLLPPGGKGYCDKYNVGDLCGYKPLPYPCPGTCE